jgi:hypothetical protein
MENGKMGTVHVPLVHTPLPTLNLSPTLPFFTLGHGARGTGYSMTPEDSPALLSSALHPGFFLEVALWPRYTPFSTWCAFVGMNLSQIGTDKGQRQVRKKSNSG